MTGRHLHPDQITPNRINPGRVRLPVPQPDRVGSGVVAPNEARPDVRVGPAPVAASTAPPGPSLIHRLPAEVKLTAALAFVAVVAVTPRHALASFALQGLALACVAGAARLPLRFLARRLAVTVPFLLTALTITVVAGGPRLTVGPLSLSESGLWAAAAIGSKTLLGALTSIVLAGTTPIPDLLAGLGRLRLPATLIAIASFMVRYLDLALDQVRRRRTAMTARAYRPRWLGHAGPAAASVGTLFVRSYERGERVHAAMLSRGYTGTMPALATVARPRASQWLTAAALPLAAGAAALGPWLAGR